MSEMSSGRRRAPAKSAAEQDVVTAWRKMYCYTQRPGVTSWIKRAIRRRERRMGKWEERDRD